MKELGIYSTATGHKSAIYVMVKDKRRKYKKTQKKPSNWRNLWLIRGVV